MLVDVRTLSGILKWNSEESSDWETKHTEHLAGPYLYKLYLDMFDL